MADHRNMNSTEAAKLLGVCTKTLLQWIKTKGVPAVKVSRRWVFDEEQLKSWQEQHGTSAAQAHEGRSRRRKKAAISDASAVSHDRGERYAMSFGVGALMLMPSREAAEFYQQEGDWDRVRNRAVSENIVCSKSVSSARRYCSELIGRLKLLNSAELDLIVSGDSWDRRNALWLAICRRYRFIADFARDVIVACLNDMKPDLGRIHYENYLEERASQHPELTEVSQATQSKLRSNLFAMLREVEYLDEQGNILEAELSPALVSALDGAYRDDLRCIPVREHVLEELLS